MDVRASQLHNEAVRMGDAYIIVWQDADGRPTIYPQSACSCTVVYDDEQPGKIVRAAKVWQQTDGRSRVNLYYPDRVERYESSPTDQNTTNVWAEWTQAQQYIYGASLINTEADAYSLMDEVPNPTGRVPVFHFANNADLGQFGVSEMLAAIPLQDALNKSVCDMLVAMEFCSLPQRYATGLEVEVDEETGAVKQPFTPGVERIWAIAAPDAKLGQFDPADLSKLVDVSEKFRYEIARVTGTPLHYITMTGDFPSGEALRVAEERVVSKVRRRQSAFGCVWEEAMRFALQLNGDIGTDDDETQLIAQWRDPSPASPQELMNTLISKQQLGVSRQQLLKEAGYGESDIERIMQENDDEQKSKIQNAQAAFNRGVDGMIE